LIEPLNQQASTRKIRKNGNSKQPVFERHLSPIDDSYDINEASILAVLSNIIEPYYIPDADEHVEYEVKREFEMPDNVQDEVPGHVEYTDIVDELLVETDSGANDLFDCDDAQVRNQASLDDKLGNDCDEEIVEDQTIALAPVAQNQIN
jgi:hypothetical protein